MKTLNCNKQKKDNNSEKNTPKKKFKKKPTKAQYMFCFRK